MSLPYNEDAQGQIKTFFRLQKKKPIENTISEDGKFLQMKTGDTVKRIPLYAFRQMTPEERQQMEDQRLTRLAAQDVLIEAAKKELREALANYKASGEIAPVVAANGKVQEAEKIRVKDRSAIRQVIDIPNPTTNQVLFDEPYETRKLFGVHNLLGKKDILANGIIKLHCRPFHLWQEYGTYDTTGVVTEAPVDVVTTGEAGTVLLTSGVRARLFYEPDDSNGFLSPLMEVEFTYKETKYSSAYQAFEAERMLAANQPILRASLLKTRSYRTISLLTRKIKGQIFPNPQAVWTDILNAMYEQHPELGQKLLETGQVSLVYAHPDVIQGGIGIPAKDKRALDTTKWKGQNVVGAVLEIIRARLREAAEPVEVVPPPAAKEAVVTREAQAAAKTGAIIQARRRG